MFFAAIAAGAVVSIAVGLWFGYHRQGTPEMFYAFVTGAAVAVLGIVALIAWIWFLFDLHVARPIEAIASAMRVRASADVSDDIDPAKASYLGDLAAAASLAATRLAAARTSLAHAVARETAELVSDKSKLEHLLGDVPPAVLLCTGRHCLVFYNSVALHMLAGPKLAVCLGRSVSDYLDDEPIRQAHRGLMEAEVPDGVVEFLCGTLSGDRRFVGRMRLAHDNDGDPGAYVMTLRDITGELLASSRRDALLTEVFSSVMPGITRLNAYPVAGEIKHHLQQLETKLLDLETRFDILRTDGWPMVATDSRQLANALKKTLSDTGISIDLEVVPLVMNCNTPDITALLRHVVVRILNAEAGESVGVTIRGQDGAAQIRLHCPGRHVPMDVLVSQLSEPIDEISQRKSAQAILDSHAASIGIEDDERGSFINLSLRPAQPLRSITDEKTHSVVYDFDLLSGIHYDRIADAGLDHLTYVVFDTETTGLFPERGDEIVQIAAVRLVNGKRVKGETFETLVNPGRPIPRWASAIHGLTDAMVANAPSIQDAIAQFHKFAEGAVLVAHNAPFDMEFLRRRERELGLRFVNPVLDTVLLSAVVFGASENHTLDALTQRLAVPLSDEERHTAMGDAVATAEAFIKLKAILDTRGIKRFDQVLAEVRRHSRLLKDLNG